MSLSQQLTEARKRWPRVFLTDKYIGVPLEDADDKVATLAARITEMEAENAVVRRVALDLANRATGTKWADFHDLGIGEDAEAIVAFLTEQESGQWSVYRAPHPSGDNT